MFSVSRPLLPACLFALFLAALPAHAQQQSQQQNPNSTYQNTPYGSYARDFLPGAEEEEKPAIWQYSKKYRGGGKLGYGARITEETVEENGRTVLKRTYHAGSQYDPRYKEYLRTGKVPDIDRLKQGLSDQPAESMPLLPRGGQYLHLVRREGLKNNEAVLRMITPVSIDGCVNVVPPDIKMRKSANMMIFRVEDGVVSLDKKAQYGHFQCESGSHVASADFILNRDELMRDKIKSLSFQASNGAMDVYDVNVTPDRLTLVPRSTTAFVPYADGMKLDPLVYDFYPDNLIILYAPSAPPGADLSAQITTLAQRKGLVESTVLKNGRGLYFIDRAGTLAGTLAFDANAYIGTVGVEETYYGPDGPYKQARGVDVYAKRPGMLD